MCAALRLAACVVICLPVFAAETCPWLSNATAAGVLGAAVTVKVTHVESSSEDGTCEFHLDPPNIRMLRIDVHTMHQPTSELKQLEQTQCGSRAVDIRGVGNEAVQCASADQMNGQVVGRVRNRSLVVLLVNKHPDVQKQVRDVAEMVAGNLF